VGDGLGRAASVIDVVAQRGGVAMSVGAKQYDDNNTMQFWGSELVSNIPEPVIHAIGSTPEDRWESVQGAGIGTHANHLGIRIGPTINLFSDMPVVGQITTCRIRNALGLPMSQQPMSERT
jgi:hypothetical protein